MSSSSAVAIGVDLVCISAFAEQLALPGSQFERVFHATELRRAATKQNAQLRAEHLAGRWAAKEAFIKAWSQSLYGTPPLLNEEEVTWSEIVVVPDAWGRVAIELHGQIASLFTGEVTSLSISHDGDYATATCLVSGA